MWWLLIIDDLQVWYAKKKMKTENDLEIEA